MEEIFICKRCKVIVRPIIDYYICLYGEFCPKCSKENPIVIEIHLRKEIRKDPSFIGLKGIEYKRTEQGLIRISYSPFGRWSGKTRGKTKGKIYRGEKPKKLKKKEKIFFNKIIPRLSWKKLRKNN